MKVLCPCHKDKTYNEDWEIIKEKKNDFLHADDAVGIDGEKLMRWYNASEKRDSSNIKYVEFRAWMKSCVI